MSHQGSVNVAALIERQQRVRRIDTMLDQLIAERRSLTDQRNVLDPLTFHGHRVLTDVPEPVHRKDFLS